MLEKQKALKLAQKIVKSEDWLKSLEENKPKAAAAVKPAPTSVVVNKIESVKTEEEEDEFFKNAVAHIDALIIQDDNEPSSEQHSNEGGQGKPSSQEKKKIDVDEDEFPDGLL